MATKTIKTVISIKDPDLVFGLQDQGLSEEAADHISAKAEFGEYFSFELTFDIKSGKVMGARQLDYSDGK